jgi:high-affinity iron transporter
MFPGYLLALREGLEAALVIGIVMSVLRKMALQKLYSAVWIGVISAIVVSMLAALGLNRIGAEFEGQGEQLFEAITMLLAAGILTWMVFWIRKNYFAGKQNIESTVMLAVEGKGKKTLFVLAFLAVVREGIELALFLMAVRLTTNPFQEFLGTGLGIMTSVVIGFVIFTSTRKMNLSRFFRITNIFIALFAAGLVGLAIREFNELGWVPAIVEHVWNLNPLLPDNSTLGQLLKSLVGYNSSPSLSQVIVYFGYLAFLVGITWLRHENTSPPNSIEKERVTKGEFIP